MRPRPLPSLVPTALGVATTVCVDDDATTTDSGSLVATTVAPTAGPAPSTAPLTVVSTTAAGAAPTRQA